MGGRKALASRDVPRPGDDSRQCLARIKELGGNHAVCDLIDALKCEGDPRYEILATKRAHNMARVAECQDPAVLDTVRVTYFQDLAVWCVRVMEDPAILRQVEDVKRRVGVPQLWVP